MKNILILVIVILGISTLSAQENSDYLSPKVNFRSKENSFYWKNKKPHSAYWQQDVHYFIDANIDDEKDVIDGRLKLIYYNNSPTALKELFFHLHQNAFQPQSYYHKLNQQNRVKVKFGGYESQGLGTIVDSITVNGAIVASVIDNTVMKVFLDMPLVPGDSIIISMNFKTFYDQGGNMRRRMKEFVTQNTKHYDGVQWYPAIAVYDHKFGWETDQDLDKEYYGDFGAFDVKLTFPHEYVVDGTGILQNKTEVLPDTLRKKLDLGNFAKKPMNQAASIIIPREKGKTKTWVFHAKNVHNFAFTADPLYRIGELDWNGIKVVALAQEPHASGWQQSAWYTLNIIKIYSMDFGMYNWPKIIVADAKDGMEYPMLTLDGGTYPQHQSLLAHEVGHMWFYGMVGNNETYRASLDEGFAQFLTVWSLDRLHGEKRARFFPNKFIAKHLDSSDTRYENIYYPYINHVTEGYDEPLNTHSSAFNGGIRHGGNYGLVYYKTATMLYNLKYVLGDELFLQAMQHYVNKWKFAHPYPEDFREAIIEFTQADLNWFFDQWLETTKFIDYAVDGIKEGKENGEYYIQFTRKGRMQMPIDFTVENHLGIKSYFHIPNTWFVKNTNATLLPKWYGWDLLQPVYTAHVKIDGKIKSVEIDPNHLLADIDLTNNKSGHPGNYTLKFDSKVPNVTSWTKAKNFWRPDIWYNNFDGLQLGGHIEGSYFNKYNYSLTAWYNSRILQKNILPEFRNKNQVFAFNFTSKKNSNKIWNNSSVSDYASYNAGLVRFGLGFEKTFRKQDNRNPRYSKFSLEAKCLINTNKIHHYLLYPQSWGPVDGNTSTNSYVNSSLNAIFSRYYNYKNGLGELVIAARSPFILSSYNYSFLSLTSINKFNFKKFEIKSRMFGQWIFGNVPYESALYLAGANPEHLVENKFTRARGFVPDQWLGYSYEINHFHEGGGLNLRGYAGYLAPDIVNSTYFFNTYGKGGGSWNVEIDFDKYIKFSPKRLAKYLKLDTYLFADAGILASKARKNQTLGALRVDAGIGSSLTIKFPPLDIHPLVVRIDVPAFLNSPPNNSDYWKFRYVVGINRAF